MLAAGVVLDDVLDDELDDSLGVVEALAESAVAVAAGGAAVVDFDEPRASFL